MWSPPQCGWWWKTGCHTDRHHGIYGATIGFSFLGQRFRTGSRRREKKAEAEITGEYLDKALANFSGYIAADELFPDDSYDQLTVQSVVHAFEQRIGNA